MKRFLDYGRFSLTRLFQWHRVLGIGGGCVVAYVLVFVVFGRSDVSWFMPPGYSANTGGFHWPSLPHFLVSTDEAKPKAPEVIYTVPTRQITPQELAQIRAAARAEQAAPVAR